MWGRIWCIAKRDYLASIRTKGFIIGLLIGPILMAAGPLALAVFGKQVDTRDRRVVLLDRSGRLASGLREAAIERNQKEVTDPESGKKVQPAYELEVVAPKESGLEQQRLGLSDEVRSGRLHGFLEIGPMVVHPATNQADLAAVRYHAKAAALDDLRRWLGNTLNNRLRRLRLEDAGIDETRVKGLFTYVNVEPMGLVSADSKTGKITGAQRVSEAGSVLVPMGILMIMYLIILTASAPMLNAVMEEKTQRISEVLLGAARPFELMAGKVLSGTAVALTTASAYLLAAAVVGLSLASEGMVPWRVLPWFVVYLVLAVLLMSSVSAALGSACGDAKDAQNLALPSMLPVIVPMLMLGPILKEPQSTFAVAMSLVPPFTPLLMLMRMSLPAGVPVWQPWLGLLLTTATTVLAIWAGARIFRVGILMQGKGPKLGELLRWIWRS